MEVHSQHSSDTNMVVYARLRVEHRPTSSQEQLCGQKLTTDDKLGDANQQMSYGLKVYTSKVELQGRGF